MVERVLQLRVLAEKLAQGLEGYDAEHCVLERHSVDDMVVGANGVQPQQVAREVKADDLAAVQSVGDARLEEAGMHLVERGQRIPLPE